VLQWFLKKLFVIERNLFHRSIIEFTSVKVFNNHFNYSSGGGRCLQDASYTIARSTDAARPLKTILLIATLVFIYINLGTLVYHLLIIRLCHLP